MYFKKVILTGFAQNQYAYFVENYYHINNLIYQKIY